MKAAVSSPSSLSPPGALVCPKSTALPFSLRSFSSSSSSYPSVALHTLHSRTPCLPIASRKPPTRPEAAVVVAAATAAETIVVEGDEAAAEAPSPPSKPKTGKAALLLKRNRVLPHPISLLLPYFLHVCVCLSDFREISEGSSAKVALLKQMSNIKFVESAEAHFRLNIDPKYNDQQLRAMVNLPKGTGQSVTVAVLTQGG
ncbi:putative 50S ribosomal protein L1, chloroplastic [Cocos nucifera]|uniref:Putative 50S ribosomal protein L1, chloroplastic n=1 Tax=Cocos nucifera TaxID=13894 RepID=A0A8K0MXL5_COCNU|nr:putative 50S ribosomal protein L1, chloroplastic [Cocos nucifera]